MPQILEITPANEIKQIIIEDTFINDFDKFSKKLDCNAYYRTSMESYYVFWNRNESNGAKNDIADPMIQMYGTRTFGEPITDYKAYGSVYVINISDSDDDTRNIIDLSIDEFVCSYNYQGEYYNKIKHLSDNTYHVAKNPIPKSGCVIV